MGLKEKQAIANLDFSWSLKRIKEYTGKDVKIELDPESFSSDMDAIMYADSRGAEKIANGIAKVCHNDIGKDAFNDKKITKVLLKNQAEGSRAITMKDGVLTLAFSYSGGDYYSENEIKDEIENQL
ncbi:hypothetical protein WSM22_04840 [Cytophagales bacterium WSM2-2]|nr:hypothetical protein WSM22_04840 [Cytophagales bacterium WSM2-2]